MVKITVYGLGTGINDNIFSSVKGLAEKHPVYSRTKNDHLLKFNATILDNFFQTNNYDEIALKITNFLIEEAQKYKKIIYLTQGNPLIDDYVVKIMETKDIELEILTNESFIDRFYYKLKSGLANGIQVFDVLDPGLKKVNPLSGLIVSQITTSHLAKEIKQKLKTYYPKGFIVKVIDKSGSIHDIPLEELDGLDWVNYLNSVYIPPLEERLLKTCTYPLDPLVNVMEKLLGPNGCPWDRKQDHYTLKKYLLEETYEVVEAIDEGNMYKLCEELGDLLLQIVFHAALASKREEFNINDIVKEITEKMIRRHPHVFAGLEITGTNDVLKNWEAIKAKEKGKEVSNSILGNVPKGLPALMHAYKIQGKAAEVGFDWPDISGAWEKLKEEIKELEMAIKENKNIYEELGDVLFAVVNTARFLKINPEEALLLTIRKFRKRFKYIEEKVLEEDKSFQDYSLEELDKWWEESKKLR